jgi:hypothetical protein
VSEELHFESAEELFRALGTTDALARRRVLAWIAANRAEVLAFGPFAGRDILDLLFGLINREWAYAYWQDVALTLGAFDSPRVTDFFLDLLATAPDALQADDAANALELRRDAEGVRERVIGIVTGDGPPDRLAAAAQVLAEERDLPEDAAIRVSLLEDEVEAPPADERTAGRWVAELAGPFGEQARDRLEHQGPPALRAIAGRWDELSAEDRRWLLEWAGEGAPREADAIELVRRGLESDDEEVALAALECAAALPEEALDRGGLAPWVQHERSEIRAAAIAAGAPADLRALLAEAEAEPEVIVAALGMAGAGDIPAEAMTPHLGSDSLEVRNAARDALVALGATAVEPLRELVHSDSPEVRAGAVRALLDLGDDDWLAGELLEERSG